MKETTVKRIKERKKRAEESSASQDNRSVKVDGWENRKEREKQEKRKRRIMVIRSLHMCERGASAFSNVAL